MSGKNMNIPVPEKFGILSAVWILASIDKNPIITYRGIQDRLKLDEYDLTAIKSLISSRGDLFRRRVPKSFFMAWIGDLRRGKNLPTWLLDVDKSQRAEIIDKLTLDDVFISQFRTNNNEKLAYGDVSETGVIDWGLQHIERLRKAHFESRDDVMKKWQLWTLLFFSFASLVLSIINILK